MGVIGKWGKLIRCVRRGLGFSEKGREAMREEQEPKCNGAGRRDFLRKSTYAAYATPAITAMLVEKASAAKSWNSGDGEITRTGDPPETAPVGPEPTGEGKDDNPTP